MRILGIDPGIGRIGWGIIDKNGQKTVSVAFGCWLTSPKESTPHRLSYIFHKVMDTIKEYRPTEIAIEDLFFNTNAKTAFVVGQARGVILLAAFESSLKPAIYTPLQVKVALTGYGQAQKHQVGQMVKKVLHLQEIPKPDDTADALAIALTHAFITRK